MNDQSIETCEMAEASDACPMRSTDIRRDVRNGAPEAPVTKSREDPLRRVRQFFSGLCIRQAVIAVLTLAWLPVAVGGLIGYFGVTAPLQKKIVVEEANGLVREVDGIVWARSVALDVTTRDLQLTNFRESAELDKLLGFMWRHFPDFIRVDVIDQSGAVVAMAGELPVSAAGLPSHVNINRLLQLDSGGRESGWAFLDDPKGNRYSIVWKRIGELGKPWFIRAEFSRDPIRRALGSLLRNADLTAQLARTSENITWGPAPVMFPRRRGPRTGSWSIKADVRTSRYSLLGAVSAQARLATPGWLLKVRSGASLFRSPLFVPMALALHLTLVCLAFAGIRQSRREQSGKYENQVAQDPQELLAAEARIGEPAEQSLAESLGSRSRQELLEEVESSVELTEEEDDEMLGPVDQLEGTIEEATDQDEFGAAAVLTGDSSEEPQPEPRLRDSMPGGGGPASGIDEEETTEAVAKDTRSSPRRSAALPWFEILDEEESAESLIEATHPKVPTVKGEPDSGWFNHATAQPDWTDDPEPRPSMTLKWDAERKIYLRYPSHYSGA